MKVNNVLINTSEVFILENDTIKKLKDIAKEHPLKRARLCLHESIENKVHEMLNFCNLKWDNNCLNFYKNKRIIKTASDVQVRSKIYNSSIDIWKKYKKNLDTYLNKLNV